MIEFLSRTEFELTDTVRYSHWIERIILSESKECGDVIYTFCDDKYLDQINQTYLNHEDYTDIISFDHTVGPVVSGDIFISIDRIKENAVLFEVPFDAELLRVLAHGVLHLCGYGDDTQNNQSLMRLKENEKIQMFHVEHF